MKKLLSLYLCLSVVLVTGCNKANGGEKDGSNSTSSNSVYVEELSDETGINLWIKGFSEYDFDLCDANVNSNGFKFNSFYADNSSNTSVVSKELYELMLHKSVDSVEWVSLTTDAENSAYEVTITYKPFKEIEQIPFDTEELIEIVDDFVVEDASKADINTYLKDFYLSTFEKCFTFEDESKEFKCTITQGIEYDIEVVENIEDLIVPLMEEQRVLYLLELFETSVEDEVQRSIESIK